MKKSTLFLFAIAWIGFAYSAPGRPFESWNEAQEWCDIFRNDPKLAHDAACFGGCAARVQYMALMLSRRRLSAGSIRVLGNPVIRIPYERFFIEGKQYSRQVWRQSVRQERALETGFKFHVALVVMLETECRTTKLIIDPPLSLTPMTVDEWQDTLGTSHLDHARVQWYDVDEVSAEVWQEQFHAAVKGLNDTDMYSNSRSPQLTAHLLTDALKSHIDGNQASANG